VDAVDDSADDGGTPSAIDTESPVTAGAAIARIPINPTIPPAIARGPVVLEGVAPSSPVGAVILFICVTSTTYVV